MASVDGNATPSNAEATNVALSTHSLEELMLERISAIDNIRSLLHEELEQDNFLIAEFSEKVIALEQELASKKEETEKLAKTNEEYKLDIAKKAEEEFKEFASTVDDLVERNESLEKERDQLVLDKKKLEDAIEPLDNRIKELVLMGTEVTKSLKEAKGSLEREIKSKERLEKEKEESREAMTQAKKEHQEEVNTWSKRLEEANASQVQLKKEMDELRKALCDEQLTNMKLTGLEAKLALAEETISKISKERNRAEDELKSIKKRNAKLQAALDSSDPQAALKKELNDLRKKLCKEQQTNTQLSGLKARLDETERLLDKVSRDKNKLRDELSEVYEIKGKLTFESQQSSINDAWLEEKVALQRRLHQSEKALVLLANNRDEMEKKLKDEIIKNKKLVSSSAKAEPTELAKLQASFYKEKKEMMKKQQELEGMLIEALQKRTQFNQEELAILRTSPLKKGVKKLSRPTAE